MKTFIADIIPKIQRYSQKLDNISLLTNQHWVLIDEINNSKNVYIFRSSNDLLIAKNGKVEKAKWEYLGNYSLLIDTADGSYLFRHGFFDENILALKIDSKNEYAFFINETKYSGELNTVEAISIFLNSIYIEPSVKQTLNLPSLEEREKILTASDLIYTIREGELLIRSEWINNERMFKVFLNGHQAPDGKYKLEFLNYIKVKNGIGEFLMSPF